MMQTFTRLALEFNVEFYIQKIENSIQGNDD